MALQDVATPSVRIPVVGSTHHPIRTASELQAVNLLAMNDRALRTAAIDHVKRIRDASGGVLSWAQIAEGFELEGEKVHLATKAKGIFRPRQLSRGALSVSTRTPREGRSNPYEDRVEQDGGLLLYRYRGTDPNHPDNRDVRACLEHSLPLIYFFGVVEGLYRPEICQVVADDRAALTFSLLPCEGVRFGDATLVVGELPPIMKRYAVVECRRRLHQQEFRERVLQAYATRCAVCELRHSPLLSAAHIVPDSEEQGVPTTSNGICLCALHHCAYDTELLGIAPDFSLHVRPSILKEADGPLHEYGLKLFSNTKLHLPSKRADHPSPTMLQVRWAKFEQASAS